MPCAHIAAKGIRMRTKDQQSHPWGALPQMKKKIVFYLVEVTDGLSSNNWSSLLKVVVFSLAVPLLHNISATNTSGLTNGSLALLSCVGHPSNVFSLALCDEVLVIVLRAVPVRQAFGPFLRVTGQGLGPTKRRCVVKCSQLVMDSDTVFIEIIIRLPCVSNVEL